jgi:hypothetical protein
VRTLYSFKTLASKHRSTVPKMARCYKTTGRDTRRTARSACKSGFDRYEGRKPRIARFGGIPLQRQRTAVLTDRPPVLASSRRNELIHRLLAESARSAKTWTHLEVHHIPETGRSQPARQTGATELETPHGDATTQDPRHLPQLPRRHPRWRANRGSVVFPDDQAGSPGALLRRGPLREKWDAGEVPVVRVLFHRPLPER